MRRIFFLMLTACWMSTGLTPSYAQSLPPAPDVSSKETEQLDFAQGLLGRGLYDMAVSEFEQFISDYPQSPSLEDAYLGIGESYFLSNNFPKAIESFTNFKTKFPNSEKIATAVLRIGQIHLQEKNYDEALKEFTSIDFETRVKGETLQAFFFYVAQTYLGKNDNVNALTYFQKATSVADSTFYAAHAWQGIAEIDVQDKKYPEAVDAYTKGAASAQDDALKSYLIFKTGETYFLSGDYAKAIEQFRQVVDQFGTQDVAHNALANIFLAQLNLGQYQEVLTQYQTSLPTIKEGADYFDIHFAAARAMIELQKYDDATALLDKILGYANLTDESKHRVMVKKADILNDQKKYQEAVTLLESVPGNAGDEDEVLFLKAQGYYGLGQFDKATQSFQDLIKNYPNSNLAKAAVLGLAHAQESAGNFQGASDSFLDYYGREQDATLKAEAFYNVILMQMKLNADASAIAKAEEYLKTFPNGVQYEQVILILGDLYAKTNQTDKAIALLQDYVTHPNVQKPDAVNFLLGYNQQLGGKTDEALATYAKIAVNQENPRFSVSAIKNSAAIYLTQSKNDQAALMFDRIVIEFEKPILERKTYLWLCGEYLKEKKFNDVLRVADKTEKTFSDQPHDDTDYFKAEANRELKNTDEAIRLYDLVLAAPTKTMYTGAAHIGKGLVLMEAAKLDEAKAEFQKALDENPDDHTIALRARFELGNIAAAQNNAEEALKFYLLIGTIYDDSYYSSESLFRAGQALEKLNRKEEAVDLYNQILTEYKDSAAAATAVEKIKALK